MQQPSASHRLEPVTTAPSKEKQQLEAANQATIDAEHGSTGWNAYDVWRERVRGPVVNQAGEPKKAR